MLLLNHLMGSYLSTELYSVFIKSLPPATYNQPFKCDILNACRGCDMSQNGCQ